MNFTAAMKLLALTFFFLPPSLLAQDRVTPKAAKGGEKQGEPWAQVPATFRNLNIHEWPLPNDLNRWQKLDRDKTRALLLKCLGEMPDRPDPSNVRIVSQHDCADYVEERFEFDNGVDTAVPGILLLPKGRRTPSPT